MPPPLTTPEISVRLQPNSWDMGCMNTVRVVIFGAIRPKTTVPEAPTIAHP